MADRPTKRPKIDETEGNRDIDNVTILSLDSDTENDSETTSNSGLSEKNWRPITGLELRDKKYYVSKTGKPFKPKNVTEKVPPPQKIAIDALLTKVKVFYDSDAEDEGCDGASHQLKACKTNSDVCKARNQLFATLFGEDHEKTVRRLNPCFALWCKQIGLLKYSFWTSRPAQVVEMIRKNLMGINPKSRRAELDTLSNDCAFEVDPVLAQWKTDWTEWRRKRGKPAEIGKLLLQQLFRHALAEEKGSYCHDVYWYSWCAKRWVEDACTAHCPACNACTGWSTWHCGKCSKCNPGLSTPCEGCDGVSESWNIAMQSEQYNDMFDSDGEYKPGHFSKGA